MSTIMPRKDFTVKRDGRIVLKRGRRQLWLGTLRRVGIGWMIDTPDGAFVDLAWWEGDRDSAVDYFLRDREARAMDPWKSWEDFGKWIS